MGKIWMPGGGGGADLDVITAGAGDVMESKVIVDKDGNPLSGTMPHLTNRSTLYHELGNPTKVILGDNAYVVKNTDNVTRAEIRYNGAAGYITPNTLIAIDQTKMAAAGGLTAGKMISGQSAFGIAGSIPAIGGQTINPGTSQQTVSSSGKYMTGNVVVNGDADLISNNILRGKNIFNVAGSDNVLRFISGNTTSGTSSISLGNGTYWYYCTINPGFIPVFALAICGSITWRNSGASINYESKSGGVDGYFGSVSTSVWNWTSSSVMLPCVARSSACYYWIFGY
jgi:hypothetical protein